jgi:hypothetical protein
MRSRLNAEGFITACDPVNEPPDKKGKPQQGAPCERILGMGFHLVNASDEPNVVVDLRRMSTSTQSWQCGNLSNSVL